MASVFPWVVTSWLVGSDCKLNIWHSNWKNGGALQHLILGPITQEASRLEVRDLMLETSWDWEKLPFELPVDIKRMILAIPTTILGGGNDKLVWSRTPHNSFDMKSAYRLAMGFMEFDTFVAKWIWKADLLPKIKTFLWMCAHNSIGVKCCLERKGVVHDNVCHICCNGSETILHALRDCNHLKQV